ncbi:MAG: PTS glucose transporter subunit IIA [Oscillospiraceae bacterium]|nr:PTS glucose transporter subunit IIA [Oscillospiraceae bacterium]
MGLFDMFFRKHTDQVASPMAGVTCPVSEVSDPTFRDEILGPGVAIRPTEGRVYAPCDGVIETLVESGQAVILRSDFGAEIMIHVGLDTVSLKGEHYIICRAQGERVKQGDLLLEFDLDAIIAAGYDMVTPVVICNSQDFSVVDPCLGRTVVPGDPIMELGK